MPTDTMISLYHTGRNGERSRQIWRSDSGTRLPRLCPDDRYRLTVYNGPRLVYSCAPESAEFVLTRLNELLEHTPGVKFTACLKCQASLQMALPAELYPRAQRQSKQEAEHTYRLTGRTFLTDAPAEYQDPDPVIRELERLNAGIEKGSWQPIPETSPLYVSPEQQAKERAYVTMRIERVSEQQAEEIAEMQKYGMPSRCSGPQGPDFEMLPTPEPGKFKLAQWAERATKVIAGTITGEVVKACRQKLWTNSIVQPKLNLRQEFSLDPEPDRTTPVLDVPQAQTLPVALTRDEMTDLDDLVFRSCEGWSDLHRAKFYLQLNALGVNLEWAKQVCRKEEAKVGK